MFFLNYLIFSFLFITILRPFSTLIHELGHGITAILLTDKKVTLYLGSYGNSKESSKIIMGRFSFFFNKKISTWNIGLCILEQQTLSINKQILVDLMGPLASFILALILSYFVFLSNLNYEIKIFLFFFNVYTYYVFLSNIIPSSTPITLDDGSITYNDGCQILQLLKLKKVPKEYHIGVTLYNNKEYSLAVKSFEKVFKNGYREQIIYQLLISVYLQIKDSSNAARIDNEYSNKFKNKFNSNDYSNSGLTKCYLNKYKEAIKDYNKAIEMDPNNSNAFNNRGYTFNILEDYESALQDFEKAIFLDKDFAYALNNRGFAKIKLGLKEDGFIDLKKSMTLDGKNSYCYLNFGVYHYDKKEYKKALEYFIKAQELDATTHNLDSYLGKVNEKLNSI